MFTDKLLPYTIIALVITSLLTSGCQESRPVWANVSVRDADTHEPIEGVTIHTMQSKHQNWHYPTKVNEKTNTEGICRFLVASGNVTYQFNMSAEGYPPTNVLISPSCYKYALNQDWHHGVIQAKPDKEYEKMLEVKVELEDKSKYLW